MTSAPDPGAVFRTTTRCARLLALPTLLVVISLGVAAPGTPALTRTASSWSLANDATSPTGVPAPPAVIRRPTVAAPAATLPAAHLACSLVSQLRLCTHGDDNSLRPAAAAGEGGGTQTSTASTRVGCYGDGISGSRIQAVYVRAATTPDHLAAMLPSFRGWAGALEKAIDDSAHQTGGARHLRFVTRTAGSGCTLDVASLVLPADAFSSFSATVDALQQHGLAARGTKYLVWSDATGYCGLASMYDDATASAGNRNNGAYPTYARIDRTCWGYAEAHEVVHMLGGVQRGAPHATAGFHCHDGRDLMCYADGSAGSHQTSVCGSAQAVLLDCGHDDYFSTAPRSGSWLATHWNVAGSAFLAPAWTDPAPAAGPSTQSAPTDPNPQPASKPSSQPVLPLPSLPPLGGLR